MPNNTSLFAQILQVVPRNTFLRLVKQTGAQRGSKGFSSWDHVVAMLFCQFGHATSLREVEDGLRVACGRLNHLGITKAPSRSTLSYANQHRPWELTALLFDELLQMCRSHRPGKKAVFKFKNPLYSLDSSVIELCAGLFPWADYRSTKGAIKLHLLLDHDGYFPEFAVISDGNTPDIHVARDITLARGSIIAVDRGYCDYSLFHDWTQQGVFFVTRLKDNAVFEVMEARQVPAGQNIITDELIRFTAPKATKDCPDTLRRVVATDPDRGEPLVFLTNHLKLEAAVIAAIYKDRWNVEIFFKTMKQDMHIKSFIGTSVNAVLTQIWTALIAILLIKFLKFRSKHSWSLSKLVVLLRWNLFTYRDLWNWLDKPYDTPPEQPPDQLVLGF